MTVPPRTVLLNPGPVNISDRVRAALHRDDICHREDDYTRLQASIRRRLCEAFAPTGYAAVLLTGSGTAALEAAVSSAVTPGRAMLVVVNGVYGDRIARMARVHRVRVVECRAEWTEAPALHALEARLAEDPDLEVVALVHHETTTGLINPVPAIGALARRYGKSLLVDSISGLGGEPLDLPGASVDLCVGTANKCLRGVPGLSFVLLRHAELARLATLPPRTVYLHLPAHHAAQENGEPLFTPAIQVGYALDEALAELVEEGVAARIAHYRAAATLLRAGFDRLGLVPLLRPELRSNTITTLRLPTSLTYQALHDALKARGWVIYAGQGPLASRVFRIANMGAVSLDEYRGFLDDLAAVLGGLAVSAGRAGA